MFVDADPLQVPSRPAAFVAGGNARKGGEVGEQFARGQMVVKVGLLGQEADLRLHLRIIQRTAQDRRRARGGINEAHQQLKRSGLAGAVGSEIAENLAFLTARVSGGAPLVRVSARSQPW